MIVWFVRPLPSACAACASPDGVRSLRHCPRTNLLAAICDQCGHVHLSSSADVDVQPSHQGATSGVWQLAADPDADTPLADEPVLVPPTI